MYSKWIMVYVLMTTNLFTLYLQDLNPCMHITVPVFGCLQNLIVNFKDHDYDVLTDWSYDYWLYIFECVFSSQPGTIDYHYVIAKDVSTLGRKRTDDPFFLTGSLKRTIRKNRFAEKNRISHHYEGILKVSEWGIFPDEIVRWKVIMWII